MKILSILFFLLISSQTLADTLGKNKTINDYLDNGYQLKSIKVLENERLLYNLIIEMKEDKIFEPKLVSCIYNIDTQISECFKP